MMTTTKKLFAIALPCALMAASISANAAAQDAGGLEDTAECRTRGTSNFGKRDSCDVKLSIEAPQGAAIDPESVSLSRLDGRNEGDCGDMEMIYDGNRVVGVTARGWARSAVMPGNSGRAEIKCSLSASIAG